jgi:hypothetical protein
MHRPSRTVPVASPLSRAVALGDDVAARVVHEALGRREVRFSDRRAAR